MFDRRLITNFNWPFLVITLVLTGLGLLNLYSASSGFEGQAHANYFKAQFMWSLVGLSTLTVVTSIHYRHFQSMSYVIYGGSVALLIAVLFVGKHVAGHQSWISLGGVNLQPTEIAKIGLIVGLSRQMISLDPRQKAGIRELIPSLIIFLIPAGLVILQGDLGSSLFYGLIFGSMVLVHGIRGKVIITMLAALVIVSILAYNFFLSPYQKDRIQTFLNPELDRRGAGYHVVQSKIAVGSGGVVGRGFMKGQTHKLKFVPERHTDFIFPVLAEEWGFVGCLMVLTGFFVFLFLGLQVAYRAPERYGFFLIIGICSLFFWHMVINLGGVLGLMPVTGVPLPFFSYGGSSLLTNWLGIGIILNISMRRFMFS